jgi:hypothetical protein
MLAESLYAFRMKGGDRRRYQVGSEVPVTHPMNGLFPLSVPSPVAKLRTRAEDFDSFAAMHTRRVFLSTIPPGAMTADGRSRQCLPQCNPPPQPVSLIRVQMTLSVTCQGTSCADAYETPRSLYLSIERRNILVKWCFR